MVVTMRRSSGKTDTSRVTRMSRASRATIAKAPAWGRSDAATTMKSNTFHPSRKIGDARPVRQQANGDLGDEDHLDDQVSRSKAGP